MKVTYFGKSDKGKVRKANEDSFSNSKLKNDDYLFIVADGMGGHRAGDVASRLGVQTFLEYYKQLRGNETPISEAMTLSLKEANATILRKATSDFSKKGMGTTFSALSISGNQAYIVHVGDSRIYLIRDSKIVRRTTDHTFVERMVMEGRITEEEARIHPQRNILYMSLGAKENMVLDVIDRFEIYDGDIFVMCSDGLNNMVSDNIIKEYALSFYPERSTKELIKLANENGGMDNVTVQVIHIGQNEAFNKTEPIYILNKKRRLITISLILVLLIILIIIFIA
jgi:serine/threonine protein phosphatase PrpC